MVLQLDDWVLVCFVRGLGDLLGEMNFASEARGRFLLKVFQFREKSAKYMENDKIEKNAIVLG
jgi:hypothetical protein